MTIADALYSEKCKNIFSEVVDFTDTLLTSYDIVIEHQLSSSCAAKKEIYDAIWGPIEFNIGEMALLDSPILQRLRYIKHLGLASHVYCGADYSRFYHTIGVVFLSSQMANIVQESINSQITRKLNPVQIVRLAAIFHDVGHMFFSHISEYYLTKEIRYSRYNEIKDMITYIRLEIAPDASLHEIVSVMIINSPSVKKMLIKVSDELTDTQIREKNVDSVVEYLGCLILGIANDKFILPYSQLIKGPFDADRCDYLSRDSHVTKVPVAVDIFRLVHKLKPVITSTIEKAKVWMDLTEENVPLYKLAVQYSAQKAFVQLIIARSFMYESVYYHHKVRTAEAMFRCVLRDLERGGIKNLTSFKDLLSLDDRDFGNHLAQILGITDEDMKNSEVKRATYMLKRVNTRELDKRVACFSPSNISGTSINKVKFNDILEDIEKSDELDVLITEIEDNHSQICSLLGTKAFPNQVDLLVIPFPTLEFDPSSMDFPIEYGNSRIKNASEAFQNDTWLQSRNSRTKENYLVTNQIDRLIVYLALEKVLFQRHHVFLTKDAYVCAKFDDQKLDEYRSKLFEKGYYDDALVLLSDRLQKAIITEDMITKIYTKFHTFAGENDYKITPEIIFLFLRQFLYFNANKKSIQTIYKGISILLNNAVFIDRSFFKTSATKILKDVDANLKLLHSQMYICRTGSMLDGCSNLTYYFNDIINDIKGFSHAINCVETIEIALDRIGEDDTLILFDDGAYSGMQIISIFQEFMNVPIEDRKTKETHVRSLSNDYQIKLKRANVVLAFLCFNSENEDNIKKELASYGFKNIEIMFYYDMKSKLVDDLVAKDESMLIVKKCLVEIGREILNSRKRNADNTYRSEWPPERIASSALGYNDAQQMAIYIASTPTFTIVPFWLKGKYNCIDWAPLFPRTPKKDTQKK